MSFQCILVTQLKDQSEKSCKAGYRVWYLHLRAAAASAGSLRRVSMYPFLPLRKDYHQIMKEIQEMN